MSRNKKPSNKKPKASSKKTASNKTSSQKSKWVKRVAIAATILLLTILGFYLAYQDYTVRKVFEGKRWSLPARVYASPSELYAGLPLTAAKLEQVLQMLYYRNDSALSESGTYHKTGNRIRIHTRSFHFWDAHESARKVTLSFSSGHLSGLSDESGDIALLRLEPVLIGNFYPTRKEDRVLVQYDDVPKQLIDGLLAIEDRAYFEHHGISVKGIARAVWQNLRAGSFVQGGSTITQQLVKNLMLSPERSLTRKINEAVMSVILDLRYDKREILEAYINEIFLGQDGSRAIHGFGLASHFYFDRPLDELKLQHIALLVGLVRGPSLYDPWKSPQQAKERRNQVLDAMVSQGFIDSAAATKAKAAKLEVRRNRHRSTSRFPYFETLIKRQLLLEYREEDLTSEGLRIFTTLDVMAQFALEQAVSSLLPQLEKSPRVEKLQTAAVITRREGGDVVALLGGRDSNSAGFNRALDAHRQIGSLIKPVIYETAFEMPARYTYISPILDTSIRLTNPDGDVWSPRNYDRKEHGEIPLYQGLVHSYNLATVRLGMEIGVGRVSKTLHEMGLQRPIDLYPSLLLGALSLSPLEVAQVYQTLAGDGFYTPLKGIHAVVDGDGQVLQRYPVNVRQVLEPGATYLTNRILQQVVQQGTGEPVYQVLPRSYNVAGKTGTTNSSRDSWFAGFTGDYLGAVWVGRDDNGSTGLTGATGALRVWAETMAQISRQPVDLFPPENVITAWIDPATGLLADEDCEGAKLYPFISGSQPTQLSPCVAVSGSKIESWFKGLFQ